MLRTYLKVLVAFLNTMVQQAWIRRTVLIRRHNEMRDIFSIRYFLSHHTFVCATFKILIKLPVCYLYFENCTHKV